MALTKEQRRLRAQFLSWLRDDDVHLCVRTTRGAFVPLGDGTAQMLDAFDGAGAHTRGDAGRRGAGVSAKRDEVLRQSVAWEQVMDLAHAHMTGGDGALQQDLYDTLLAYAGEERDALIAALVAEYACVLARRDHWRLSTWSPPRAPREERIVAQGARAALVCVATRLGISDLHARAAEALARGEEEAEP